MTYYHKIDQMKSDYYNCRSKSARFARLIEELFRFGMVSFGFALSVWAGLYFAALFYGLPKLCAWYVEKS